MPTDLNVRAYGAQTIGHDLELQPGSERPSSRIRRRLSRATFQGGPFTEPAQGYEVGCVLGGSDTAPPCISNLKGIYQDEYTLGFDKALDPTFAVGVKGTYRHYGRTIEDRCDVDSAYPEANHSTCVIFNPGSDDPFATGDFHGCAGLDSSCPSTTPAAPTRAATARP